LFYNKKMLQDAGYDHPPRTWNELIEMSTALKQKGIVKYPMVFSWGANYEQITVDYVMLVKSLGGEIFDAQGNPVFNQGAGVEALQMMYDMMHTYEIVDPAALTLIGGGQASGHYDGWAGSLRLPVGNPPAGDERSTEITPSWGV
jgi:multiple sugar transport system substrate-binding protein